MNLPGCKSIAISPLPQSRNWKLVLSYDGTDFHGWQVQPAQRTIQGEVAAAIQRVTGEQVLPQGSGRTDAGVHALGQVASFRLSAPIPPENLRRALNRTLPPTIRVLSARWASESFHARHSALDKTYEYRICRDEICTPFLSRYTCALNYPLNVEAMQSAASLVMGEHDFTSFAAADPDLSQRVAGSEYEGADVVADEGAHEGANTRTIYESSWESSGHEAPCERVIANCKDLDAHCLLIYRVRGSGFLHHMVRNLVGTFLDAGRGHINAEHVAEILAARKRSAGGPTAPARGLFLISVAYSDSEETGDATLNSRACLPLRH